MEDCDEGAERVDMTRKKISGFRFKPRDDFLSQKDAEVVGQRIVELREEGKATPKAIVADARDLKSPLHKFFEWDDTKASEKWRLDQARALIHNVVIEISYEGGLHEKIDVKAFHSVVQDGKRSYASAITVFSQEDLAAQVVESARKELEAWIHRYDMYEELSSMIALVREALERVPRAEPSRRRRRAA